MFKYITKIRFKLKLNKALILLSITAMILGFIFSSIVVALVGLWNS